MRIGIVGDIHWSKYSSILRSRGEKYSTRLENCIATLNWIEQEMKDMYDKIIYLGDFFDKSELSAEEISALKEVMWNEKEHTFLTGNHEMGMNDLSFTSSHLFSLCHMDVVDKPCKDDYSTFEVCYLPYILEDNRKSLTDYFGEYSESKPRLIVSHNDIEGIQMGVFVSQSGFSVFDIEMGCTLFLNGHLHNGLQFGNGAYNVGNITGQNFSEDAHKYKHEMFIVNTDDMSFERFENPYAVNFYKFDYSENKDEYDLSSIRGDNCVVTVKISERYAEGIRQKIENTPQIIAHRLIVVPEVEDSNESVLDNVTLSVDHLEKFKEFVAEKLGTSDTVTAELLEVIK